MTPVLYVKLPLMSGGRRFLLVYPRFEPTMWGLQYTLPLIGKKSLLPPLGLMTVAALTPPEYELRLVDMNVRPLTDADLDWAAAGREFHRIGQKVEGDLLDGAAREFRPGRIAMHENAERALPHLLRRRLP